MKIQGETPKKEGANNDEKWSRVIDTCQEAGKIVLGMKENTKVTQHNTVISNLKDQRHNLKVNIDACNFKEVKEKLERERKGITDKIRKQLKAEEEKDLDQKMKRLESLKDDNSKYFYVMREVQNMNRNKKSSMLVKDSEGNVPGSTTEKIKIIENYFKSTLAPEDMQHEFLSAPPCPMNIKFTAEEIQKIAKRLNTDKAQGPDRLQAEMIKNAPLTTFQENKSVASLKSTDGESRLGGGANMWIMPFRKRGDATKSGREVVAEKRITLPSVWQRALSTRLN